MFPLKNIKSTCDAFHVIAIRCVRVNYVAIINKMIEIFVVNDKKRYKTPRLFLFNQ